jgi:hypothetical protein
MLVAAPVVTRPFVWVIALPFVAVRGVAGRLATENALRAPRRTTTTASALMVGPELISGLSAIPQGVQASVTERFGNELTVLGTMVGLGLGVALQRGLESQGLRIVSIPWTADSGHADRLGRGRRPRRHPPRDPRGPPQPPAGDRQWPVGTASPGIPLAQSRLDPINLLRSRLWSHLDLCHAHDLDAPVLVAAC